MILSQKKKTIDNRVSETEKAYEVIASVNENHSIELKRAKEEIKHFKSSCEYLEKESKEIKSQETKLHSKVLELEQKKMNDNLIFTASRRVGKMKTALKV